MAGSIPIIRLARRLSMCATMLGMVECSLVLDLDDLSGGSRRSESEAPDPDREPDKVSEAEGDFDTELVDGGNPGRDAASLDASATGGDAKADCPTLTASFQDGIAPSAGYQGTRDTSLRQAAPALNLGTSANTVDGDTPTDTGQDDFALLRWDLSSLPSGSVVKKASLTVHVTNATVSAYQGYELLRSWNELEASWLKASTSSAWEVAGALGGSDRGTAVLLTIANSNTLSSFVTYAFTSAGLASVQKWVQSPSSNHGIVIGNTISGDGFAFASREAVDPAQRPRLTITYTNACPGP